MKQTVYVVTMYRWGDRECHSYLLGVYSIKTKAEKAALTEKDFRGGNKYYPEILEITVNGPPDMRTFKVIMALDRNPDFAPKYKPT